MGSSSAERRIPCSIPTVRLSGAKYNILSAEEEKLAQLGACFRLMSKDMGDHPLMIALPLEPRARGRSSPAMPIVNDRSTRGKAQLV